MIESAILGFLLIDVLTDHLLVPSNRGHKVAPGPKVLASEVFLPSEEGSGDLAFFPLSSIHAKAFPFANFELSTRGRLSHTPANVKLWESPGKAGGLPKGNYPYYLMYATGEKMNITQIEGSYPQVPEPDLEKRREFVEGWDAAPERFKKWFMDWEPRQHPSIEASVNIADWNETMHYIDDAIGTCAFLSSFRGQFGGRPPYHIYNLPAFISLATGLDVDSEGLWKTAARNRNLVRAINVRRGLRRNEEAPPADHWKKRDPEMEQKVLDAYYAFKGWNNEGIPTRETLDSLGLDYVSEDFLQRGILENCKDQGRPAGIASAA